MKAIFGILLKKTLKISLPILFWMSGEIVSEIPRKVTASISHKITFEMSLKIKNYF